MQAIEMAAALLAGRRCSFWLNAGAPSCAKSLEQFGICSAMFARHAALLPVADERVRDAESACDISE